MIYLFLISFLLIIHHFILYPLIISYSKRKYKLINKSEEFLPFVSYIIPVHNEEKIIENKIKNVFSLNYPKDKLEVIITNDYSSDKTVDIVKEFMKEFDNLKLLNTKNRLGKVNAQNEAVKISKGEILAFSDANTMWEKDSLKKIVMCLREEDVSLVCGKIVYKNPEESQTSYSESLYWKLENKIKELESNFYSLTAINGGIYAIKKDDYIFLNPMFSHDIAFPILLAREKKRVAFCNDALAFERSGLTLSDEWKRKVRMFGRVYYFLFKNLKLLINPFLYNPKFYFSLFSHRIIRYTLPLWHFFIFISSFYLMRQSFIFELLFYLHIFIILSAPIFYFTLGKKFKLLNSFFYYLVFIISMIVGFINFIFGKTKPFWSIAESTREFLL